ncbi:tetratricopeptide repeat protein [Streptomyces hirsutus]|uniref:tetratricopeptide repeat protein n=1 Tax=Streptomyces hirsutus TaxID=35620 RepID=UPI0033B2F2E8
MSGTSDSAHDEAFYFVENPQAASAPALDAAIESHETHLTTHPDCPTRGLRQGLMGNLLAERGERTGNREDVARAVDLLRAAASDPALGDASEIRGQFLYNLGNVLTKTGVAVSVETLSEGVDAYRQALRLLSGPERLACASNMLPELLQIGVRAHRPELRREAQEIAWAFLDEAPADSRAESSIWTTLLDCLSEDLAPADAYRSLISRAEALTRQAAPDGLRAERFDRLGLLLRKTWKITSDSDLLTQAIAASRRAVSLCPIRATLAANLALILSDAGTLHDDPELLEGAVHFMRRALELTLPESNHHPSMRGDLGSALFRLSEHRDQEENLRAALDNTTAAVEHARRTGDFGLLRTFLPNLAMARLQLATVTHDRDLMSDAIESHREALTLPLRSSLRAKILNNYGAALSEFAELAGQPATELRQACEAMAESLALIPDDEPQLGDILGMYVAIVLKLLLHDHTAAVLNAAIDAWERILACASSRSLDEPALLCRTLLAATYWRRYDYGTDLHDVNRALEHAEHVLRHPPPDTEPLLRIAYVAAEAYRMRASVTHDPADFERAIDLVAEVLERADLDDETRQDFLTVQSANLHDRFHAFSALPDLDEALSHAHRAVAVPVPADPESAALLQLAACLSQRHQQGGPPEHLDLAVEIYRAAWASVRARQSDVQETGAESASRVGSYSDSQITVVHNLAASLAQRYNRHGIPSDLDEAVDAMVTVLRLTPDGHRKRSERLTAAANMFRSRWFLNNSPDDLTTCLTYTEEAVAAAAQGSFAYYYAVAALVGIHGDVRDGHEDDEDTEGGEDTGTDREDLLSRHEDSRDRAIELGLRTVEAEEELPIRHWAPVAHNTAAALLRRWLVAEDRSDLEKSIALSRRALDGADLERSPISALLLGQSLIHHARTYSDDAEPDRPQTITEAAAVLRALAAYTPAPARMRFAAARWWAAATGRPDEETIAAYRQLMELIPLVAWVGAPRTVRETALADQAGLVSMAAQAALDAGRPTDAVEFLELGRGVLWSQSIDLRTDLAEIEEADPELAARLAAVRHALDSSPSLGEVTGGLPPKTGTPEPASPEPVDPDWADALLQARDISISGNRDSLFDFLAPLTTADDSRVAASAEFGRALVLLDRGDRDGAREALVRAASHGSHIAPAAANALGDLFAADDDFAAARAAYEQARASVDPSEAEEAAAKLRRLDEIEAAAARLDPPLTRVLAHGDTPRLIAAGLQLMSEGRFPQAHPFLDRAFHLLPPEEKPLLAPVLAQVLQRTGDYPGARTAWELAMQAHDPKVVATSALVYGDFLACEYTLEEARITYALALDAPSTADEARARLTALAPAPPSDSPADLDFDYGHWLAHHQPREVALTPVTTAIEAGDRNPRTHYYLTEITDYTHDPDPQRARNHLHRVLALATEADTPLVLLCRAGLRRIRRDRHGAQLLFQDAYQAAVAAGDSELAALAAVKQAELLRSDGDFDAAHAAYQRAVRTGHPSHSLAVAFDMAGMLSEAGREEEARSTYRYIMASSHPVQGGMSAINLGVSLLRSGDTPGAVEAFEWAANGAWEDAAGRAREMLAALASPS